MGYTIEISFDMRKQLCNETIRRELIIKSESLNCDEVYWTYEIEGDTTIRRNHCIVTTTFQTIDSLIRYIRYVKSISNYYVESLYTTEIQPYMLYASRYYLKSMDKTKRGEYREKRKNRLWKEEEAKIIKILKRN
jgi:hypothetical protein